MTPVRLSPGGRDVNWKENPASAEKGTETCFAVSQELQRLQWALGGPHAVGCFRAGVQTLFVGRVPWSLARRYRATTISSLPAGFIAEPRVHLGNYYEIDVCTFGNTKAELITGSIRVEHGLALPQAPDNNSTLVPNFRISTPTSPDFDLERERGW